MSQGFPSRLSLSHSLTLFASGNIPLWSIVGPAILPSDRLTLPRVAKLRHPSIKSFAGRVMQTPCVSGVGNQRPLPSPVECLLNASAETVNLLA